MSDIHASSAHAGNQPVGAEWTTALHDMVVQRDFPVANEPSGMALVDETRGFAGRAEHLIATPGNLSVHVAGSFAASQHPTACRRGIAFADNGSSHDLYPISKADYAKSELFHTAPGNEIHMVL